MGDVFVGLDLGTTSIKAVAFDLAAEVGKREHRAVATASVPTPTHRLAAGGAEYDADELWEAAASVLRELAGQVAAAGDRVRAVAAASMGESGVLVDGGGAPVAPVIAWFDPRTEPQARWWADQVGAEPTIRIAGVAPRPVFGAAKMLWTRTHLPQAWNRGRRWLNVADWAVYRLTGEMATDHSLASRTMLFDVARRRWSSELIEAAGFDESRLAPLAASGTAIGRVSAEASAATGLAAGTVVGMAGQDHVCAAFALGVTEPAMLLDSIGTAEAFFLVTERFDPSGKLAQAGVGQGAHVAADRTYAMTGLQQGGGRIDARRRELGLDWSDFLATADAAEVIEAVASEGQARIAAMLDASGITLTGARHIVTGGGSTNAALIDRKRAIGGRPITIAEEVQATALGAAMLARIAATS